MRFTWLLAAIVLLLGASACSKDVTQALVHVDAEASLQALGDRLCLRVRDAANASLVGERCLNRGEFTWPATLPVHRLASSARDEFAFEAELLDGTNRVAIARARATFVPHRTRALRLELTNACGGSCAAGTTCVSGSCEPACFELGPSGDTSLSVPMPCPDGVDAGVDAGSDASLDAGPDASLDAGPDASLDAGPDATSDAGDAGPCRGFVDDGGACRCAGGLWWDLDFDEDPTIQDVNGDFVPDWSLRDGSTFPTFELRSGVWRTSGGNLDSRPGYGFTSPTSVHLRFRNTTVGGHGAAFFLNGDGDGASFATIHIDLNLLAAGGQQLTLFGRTGVGASATDVQLDQFGALPETFVDMWLWIDAPTDEVTIWIDGARQGTYSYPRTTGIAAVPAATLLGYGSEAEFDSVRIESCPDGVMTPEGIMRP